LLECLRRPSKSHPRKWLASNATCVVSTDAMSALTPCCCHALKHSPNCVFIYGRRQQGAAEKVAAARVAAGKVLTALWAAEGALQARRLADDSGLPQITRPFRLFPFSPKLWHGNGASTTMGAPTCFVRGVKTSGGGQGYGHPSGDRICQVMRCHRLSWESCGQRAHD
jgi:hypothetical protein